MARGRKPQKSKVTSYDPQKHDVETILQAHLAESEEQEATERIAEESKGLGDTIEKITEATGIKKAVKWLLGDDCGCDERKAKLNQMFPYKKPNCLTESEYEYLHNWFTKTRTQISNTEQREILAIYNRVFNAKETISSCSTCWRDRINQLKKVYEEYN